MSVIWESANWIRQFGMLPFHILSDIYITYLLIIIYDKDIKSYIIYENKGNVQGLSIRYEYTSPILKIRPLAHIIFPNTS